MTEIDISQATIFKKCKPKKQGESNVVKACMEWLQLYGCFAWRNSTGALPDKWGNWVSFGKKGSPDIIGITPNGRFIGVECKSARGELSDDQKKFRDMVTSKNGLFIIASRIEALEAMRDKIFSEYW